MRIYSGKNGQKIHDISTPEAGIDVCCAGDIDRDGVNDIAAVYLGSINEVVIISGKTFKTINKISLVDLIGKCPYEILYKWVKKN